MGTIARTRTVQCTERLVLSIWCVVWCGVVGCVCVCLRVCVCVVCGVGVAGSDLSHSVSFLFVCLFLMLWSLFFKTYFLWCNGPYVPYEKCRRKEQIIIFLLLLLLLLLAVVAAAAVVIIVVVLLCLAHRPVQNYLSASTFHGQWLHNRWATVTPVGQGQDSRAGSAVKNARVWLPTWGDPAEKMSD